VVGVLAKWVSVCAALDLTIEPLKVLALHLRSVAVLSADDQARLLEVVSTQSAAEAQKRTKKSAQEKEAVVDSEWTNTWRPNAQTSMKNQLTSKTAGKQKTTPPRGGGTPQPPPSSSPIAENSKLLHEFFAVRPHDLAAALTARHWAIFGPIPLLNLVRT
jgi:hypothetical protein